MSSSVITTICMVKNERREMLCVPQCVNRIRLFQIAPIDSLVQRLELMPQYKLHPIVTYITIRTFTYNQFL